MDAGSLRRLLDLRGWQFFDRPGVDATLGGVRGAPEREKKVLCEGEWEKSATDRGEKGYDFAAFSWLV